MLNKLFNAYINSYIMWISFVSVFSMHNSWFPSTSHHTTHSTAQIIKQGHIISWISVYRCYLCVLLCVITIRSDIMPSFKAIFHVSKKSHSQEDNFTYKSLYSATTIIYISHNGTNWWAIIRISWNALYKKLVFEAESPRTKNKTCKLITFHRVDEFEISLLR